MIGRLYRIDDAQRGTLMPDALNARPKKDKLLR